jgi:hypothetical protein
VLQEASLSSNDYIELAFQHFLLLKTCTLTKKKERETEREREREKERKRWLAEMKNGHIKICFKLGPKGYRIAVGDASVNLQALNKLLSCCFCASLKPLSLHSLRIGVWINPSHSCPSSLQQRVFVSPPTNASTSCQCAESKVK